MCDECLDFHHIGCLNILPEDLNRIKLYICNKCEASTDRITEWKAEMPTREQALDKRLHYFEVDKIVAHKFHYRHGRFMRLFKIQWKGYSPADNSWVHEACLDGCLDLLQAYCRANFLSLSNVIGLLGASSDESRVNTDNWVSMEQIISTFSTFKENYFPSVDLQGQEWSEFEPRDGVYFLNFDRHCYVVLYIHKAQLGFISDGACLFRDEIETADEIRSLLGISLVPCTYAQQTKIDHCGSSAVLIALEMVRAYQVGIKPVRLSSPDRWKKRITEAMHKYKSELANLPPLHLRRIQLSCPNCRKAFKFGHRRQYAQHVRLCAQNVAHPVDD